jgi:ketosteroid isomerase-like protein
MKYHALLLLSFALFLIFPESLRAQDSMKELRAKIDDIGKKLEAASIRGDYELILSYYADDIIIDHPLEPPIRGKDAARVQIEKGIREGLKYHSFSGTIEDLWECGGKVYERGSWGMSYTSKHTRQPVGAYGSYFEIWMKGDDDSYKIQYLIYTLDFNPTSIAH